MGLEEQREEREVLDSIFPDEIIGEFLPFVTHCACAHMSKQLERPVLM